MHNVFAMGTYSCVAWHGSRKQKRLDGLMNWKQRLIGLVRTSIKTQMLFFAIAGTERRLYRAVSRAHHNPHLHHWFIYSMFAGYPRNFPPISDIDAFMEKIRRFPAHRFQEEFGPYTVLISNPREFVQRIKETCRLNDYTMKCGYVRYYESDQDSVGINEPDNSSAMFYKPQDYAYQQEYRIAIETGEYQTATLMLNIGDISDIAVIYETRSIFINTVLERDIPCINIKGHGPLTQPLQG